MLISQKYNSLNDIDPEFIKPLESLLGNIVPHINILKNYELNAPQDITFSYYLFFGNKTNSPIGFAQLEFKNNRKLKKSLFSKMFKKDPVENQFLKDVKWTICGVDKEGILFDPRYVSSAKESTCKIIDRLRQREDINSQSIFFSDSHAKILNLDSSEKAVESIIPDTLIKNQSSYQDFFESLSSDLKKEVKENWRLIQKELGLELGDYGNFKHSFQYKENGPAQYKKLKNNDKLKKYSKEDSTTFFLTLESKKEISLLVIFLQGYNGSSFYDVIYKKDSISDIMIHQLALMKFYDSSEYNKLHFLGNTNQKDHLFNIGFTTKKISHINIKAERSQ